MFFFILAPLHLHASCQANLKLYSQLGKEGAQGEGGCFIMSRTLNPQTEYKSGHTCTLRTHMTATCMNAHTHTHTTEFKGSKYCNTLPKVICCLSFICFWVFLLMLALCSYVPLSQLMFVFFFYGMAKSQTAVRG